MYLGVCFAYACSDTMETFIHKMYIIQWTRCIYMCKAYTQQSDTREARREASSLSHEGSASLLQTLLCAFTDIMHSINLAC